MPLFALANAGVTLEGGFAEAFSSRIAWGVALGLVVGKQLGITLAAWLAVRLGLATLPRHIGWAHIYCLGWLGGIGFTMSLFVATLAFGDTPPLEIAKLAVLAASLVSGLGGWLVFKLAATPGARAV
jgi:NhaA family Na+:H+ antiporter